VSQFNIFVDNPCCVLTQDEAKRFINGKEREKYNFFLAVLDRSHLLLLLYSLYSLYSLLNSTF
jgi:hypothetical protein